MNKNIDSKKHTGTFIEIESKLYKDIKLYTAENGLTITPFINSLLKKAFMIEKYGDAPACLMRKEEPKPVEKPIFNKIEQAEEIEQKSQEVESSPDKKEKKQTPKGKKIITY